MIYIFSYFLIGFILTIINIRLGLRFYVDGQPTPIYLVADIVDFLIVTVLWPIVWPTFLFQRLNGYSKKFIDFIRGNN